LAATFVVGALGGQGTIPDEADTDGGESAGEVFIADQPGNIEAATLGRGCCDAGPVGRDRPHRIESRRKGRFRRWSFRDRAVQ
jgi:hypothetical protein